MATKARRAPPCLVATRRRAQRLTGTHVEGAVGHQPSAPPRLARLNSDVRVEEESRFAPGMPISTPLIEPVVADNGDTDEALVVDIA